MSIGYRSVVYCGWVVNSDEISQLDDDVYENLMDSGTLMLQNSWTGDSLYAYVLCNACVEANDEAIISISDIDWPEPVDTPVSIAQFYKLFPHRTAKTNAYDASKLNRRKNPMNEYKIYLKNRIDPISITAESCKIKTNLNNLKIDSIDFAEPITESLFWIDSNKIEAITVNPIF